MLMWSIFPLSDFHRAKQEYVVLFSIIIKLIEILKTRKDRIKFRRKKNVIIVIIQIFQHMHRNFKINL